ncbi:MAG: hypothetical protein JWL69_1213 [Phycisphaerales bacterium]|nr:hypothetical protein [Phycisphaerales bacterium]
MRWASLLFIYSPHFSHFLPLRLLASAFILF